MADLLDRIHFSDIPVSNLEYSLFWYQSLLGFEVGYASKDIGILHLEHGPALILTRSAKSATMSPFVDKPVPIVGFRTRDIDKLHNALLAKGVAVTAIRKEPIGSLFGFADPDGNMFSVLSCDFNYSRGSEKI